jgi:hypothetical protein
MERLSLNPYPLRRLKASESLPFTLPALTAIQIADLSVEALQAQGRLFVVDHSYQVCSLGVGIPLFVSGALRAPKISRLEQI